MATKKSLPVIKVYKQFVEIILEKLRFAILIDSATKYSLIGAVSTAIAQLFQIFILGKYLSEASFAAYAILIIVINCAVVIVEFGVGNYLLRTVLVDQKSLRRILAQNLTTFFVALVCLIYFFPLMPVTAPPGARWVGYAAIGGFIWFSAINRMQIGILQRYRDFRLLAVGEIFGSLFLVASNFVFGSALQSEYAPIFAGLIATIVKAAIWFQVIIRLKCGAQLCHGARKSFFCSGSLQTIERIFDLICANLDKILIVKLIGVNQMGLYAFAASVALAPKQLIGTVFNRTALAEIVAVQSNSNIAKEVYLNLVKRSAVAFGVVYIGISGIGPYVLECVFKGKWTKVYGILPLFCVYGFCSGISSTIGVLTITFNRNGLSLMQKVFENALVVIVVLCLSDYGLIGVVLSYVLIALVLSFTFERYIAGLTISLSYAEYMRVFMVWLLPFMISIGLIIVMRWIISCVDGG